MNGAHCIYREENAESHLEIWQEGDVRSLWFDDVILQSEIHLEDPAVLPNPVNRAMLAHLMFDRPLQRVLLAGCGGGAIARWFNRRDPAIVGDAVEVSPTVARLAREYFDFPPPSSNWHIHIADVRQFLAHSRQQYDYILFDLEENQLTPAWVTEPTFLTLCRDHLKETGTLTLNLISESVDDSSAALLNLRQVFDSRIALVANPEHDNLITLASPSGIPGIPAKDQLERLGRQWGIDFAGMGRDLTALPPAAG